ncbi:MAG: tRNA uridine-5-carboxymethylaminomethyl(34) synthesis GTPase MnmE, partial [Rhodospirillales bacterium]|nr:tRNA uridine-5-carboxymethylaminomethyl(34) synthesis GTPase MnmE [Rhodospirillales bacterium]
MVSQFTIFALSSGHPPAGLAVIRVSGENAATSIEALTSRKADISRALVRANIHRPYAPSEVIDDGLFVWFKGPNSFTGEDCVEFHVHGGRAVIAAVLAALETFENYRMAEPGEFTRRAFDNGKLNLSEAEGLADLIAARTEAQRRQALRQLEGGLGRQCLVWRETLKKALAHMEATIDFSDEDLPDTLDSGARDVLESVRGDIASALSDGGRGESIRDGISVAIIGPPNAGKSSLLNLLAQREAAIVSKHAGTTRDIIEVHLDLGGFPVILSDTAGIRTTEDEIEKEGVRRAQDVAHGADLCLVIFDGESWPDVVSSLQEYLAETARPSIGIVNKVDLLNQSHRFSLNSHDLFAISVKTGAGIDGFMEALEAALNDHYGDTEEA